MSDGPERNTDNQKRVRIVADTKPPPTTNSRWSASPISAIQKLTFPAQKRTALDGRALGFARWDKLWAKPAPSPKFIFKIMFLHDFFGYLPLRHLAFRGTVDELASGSDSV